jgi:hypothetical protein
VFRALEPAGDLIADHRVEEIYDKGPGKGALMYESRLLSSVDRTPVAELRVATFLRANGGLGGCTDRSPLPYPQPADRAPDASVQLSSPLPENAAYQLGAEFVAALNLQSLPDGQVILRGVCAFAVAARGLLKICCDMDATRLQKMSLRYAGAMYSCETIIVDVWNLEPGSGGVSGPCARAQYRAVEERLHRVSAIAGCGARRDH